MPPTPARQRNAVSEGMALGLLLNGRDTLTYDKPRIDLSFAGAWRSWPHRAAFPQVNTDLDKGLDAVHAMTRATSTKHVFVLSWEQVGHEWFIRARQSDWRPDDGEDVAFAVGLIDGGISATGWHDLAREFLQRFDR